MLEPHRRYTCLGPNPLVRLNLRIVALFLGSSWWILGFYEPSKLNANILYVSTFDHFSWEKKTVAF